MTNDGLVVSNWFGDQRLFDNGVGGHSAMARLAWDAWFGGRVELRYRTLQNQVYNDATYGSYPYQRYHETSVGYSRPWKGMVLGGEFDTGSDVFGHSFSRLAGFVRYNDQPLSADWLEAAAATQLPPATAAASCSSRRASAAFARASTSPARAGRQHHEQRQRAFALGARREVSEHSDLGARVESDDSAATASSACD